MQAMPSLGILALLALALFALLMVGGGVALAVALAARDGRRRRPRPAAGGSNVLAGCLGSLILLVVFGVFAVAAMMLFGLTGAPNWVAILGIAVLGVLLLPTVGLVLWAINYPRLASPPARAAEPRPARRWPRWLRVVLWLVLFVVALASGWAAAFLVVSAAGAPTPLGAEGRLTVALLATAAGAVMVGCVLGLFLLPLRPAARARPVAPLPVAKPVPSAVPAPPRACPKCGAALAPDAPQGLCPRCLLGNLLPDDPKHSPTTGYVPFTPPAIAEVAEFFPQLEILGLIGQGGMGAVYLARQKALDRLVALKLIRVRDDDPAFAERFVREAKAMARLSHPNIVTIHESGEAGGLPYLIMEYVDGVTLRDAMREKRLTPAEALRIIPQVCDALEYAHAQGVVHRDVKPENILIAGGGVARLRGGDPAGEHDPTTPPPHHPLTVKIADFGLAKLADPNGLTLTRTHQAMGTPHYMAPEQWERPAEVDHRADIYALGVVLYELLTGELPLGRFDPPSVKARVDARIDELILRALAKEPGRRFQHASDVKHALERYQAGAGWVRTPTFREYRSRATLLGWPLVHVTAGRDPATGRAKVAKGWLAISDSTAVGFIAIASGWAFGGLALAGGCAAGVVALAGGMAAGVVAGAGGGAAGALLAAAGGTAASAGLATAGGAAYGKFAVAGGHGGGEHVWASNRQDPAFAQRLSEWVHTVWTDYLWPF